MTKRRQKFLDRLNLTCPADAIEAMVRGLKRASKWKNFTIWMSSYGTEANGMCYGCAATCTLMEAAHLRFKPGTIVYREKTLGVDVWELSMFEWTINDFRRGSPKPLFDFFEQPVFENKARWYLKSTNWARELPKVETYLKKLKTLKPDDT